MYSQGVNGHEGENTMLVRTALSSRFIQVSIRSGGTIVGYRYILDAQSSQPTKPINADATA
jgi:hypothetical protein